MSYQWYWPDNNPESWDFDQWRRNASLAPVESPQMGLSDPLPLLDPDADLRDWEGAVAPGWRAVSDELLGKLTDVAPAAVSPQPVGPKFETAKYSMQRQMYPLTEDEMGFAWLLTPHEPLDSHAAVLALHPTAPNGKDQIVGLDESHIPTTGSPYARALAERGLAVLAPDAVTFGERQGGHRNSKYKNAWQFFDAHPEGSVLAKMSFDSSRAIDVLWSLGYRRFGAVGHSHGAYGSLFAMLADDRIGVGVFSCGINLLRDDPGPDRWWRQTALMPRLGLGDEERSRTPIDFHHWLALLAPKPVMVIAGTEDPIFPNCAPLDRRLGEVRGVYDLYGLRESLQVDVASGGHVFREAPRERGFQMLLDHLVEQR